VPHTDRLRLAKIMIILLDNAIKYTSADGKIDISAALQDTSAKVSIKDTGMGIPTEEQNMVFTKFFRSSNMREYGGYGLSLYIAKNLTELMGGTIGFESEPGKGSTFWFTLPIAEPEASLNS
jgi:signal transduction histidine kinase